MIMMNNGYGYTRDIVFERTAPRYEIISFSAGWEMFGILDLKVGLTLNWNENTESIYKHKSTGEGYETVSGSTLKLDPGNQTYWMKSTNSSQVNFLVDYTLQNEVTYDSGHEVNITVKSGVNVFGTLKKKMTLSASNDATLINKNSLLKYDTVSKMYKSVSYTEELDSKVGYFIAANLSTNLVTTQGLD